MFEFFTDNLDHAVEFVAARFGVHSRIARGRGAFGFGYRGFAGNAVTVGWARRGLGQVLRATVPEPITLLHLPMAHAGEYRIGRKVLRASHGKTVMLPAGVEYTLREPAGQTRALVVKTDTLVNTLEADWQGRRGHLALRPSEFRLSAVNQAQLLSLCSDFERVGRLPSAQQDPQRVGDLENRLVAWLAREIANQAGLQPLSPRNRHRVEALSRWIDAHLAENIDLDRLATVAGVGPRALAKLCMAARGVTPMQLLQARRLAAAHRLLVQGGEGIRVARVSHECGFSHLGRFAGVYGDAFGESPSDTLARSRSPDRESAG